MTSLAGKVVAIHRALESAGLPHAFGGALALAWCTRQARGTNDIDVNVFVPTTSVNLVVHGLPAEISVSAEDRRRLEGEGQVRLHWDTTPVDIFLNTSPFHEAAMHRASREPFAGEVIPFLACSDLAVFKAFFDRRRDWADIEEMLSAGTLDVEEVLGVVRSHLGPDDDRLSKLREIADEVDRG